MIYLKRINKWIAHRTKLLPIEMKIKWNLCALKK